MKLATAKKIVDAVEAEFVSRRNGHQFGVLREYTRVYDGSITIVIDSFGPGSVLKTLDMIQAIEDKIEKQFKTNIFIVPAHPEVCDVPKRIGVPR